MASNSATKSEDFTLATLSPDDYIVKRLVGRGSFGKCHLIQFKDSCKRMRNFLGKSFVLKIWELNHKSKGIHLTPDWMNKKIFTEITTMYKIGQKNMNFVRVYANVFENGLMIGFIMDYCERGSVRSYLNKLYHQHQTPFPWLTFHFAEQICRALKYLQEDLPNAILHKDVSADNILITEDFVAKLCDFGFTKELEVENGMSTLSLSVEKQRGLERMPPELLSDSGLAPKDVHNTVYVDRFQFGICLIEVFSRQNIRDSITDKNNYQKLVRQGGLAKFCSAWIDNHILKYTLSDANDEALVMLKECVKNAIDLFLQVKPENRAKFSEVAELWLPCLNHRTCIDREMAIAQNLQRAPYRETFTGADSHAVHSSHTANVATMDNSNQEVQNVDDQQITEDDSVDRNTNTPYPPSVSSDQSSRSSQQQTPSSSITSSIQQPIVQHIYHGGTMNISIGNTPPQLLTNNDAARSVVINDAAPPDPADIKWLKDDSFSGRDLKDSHIVELSKQSTITSLWKDILTHLALSSEVLNRLQGLITLLHKDDTHVFLEGMREVKAKGVGSDKLPLTFKIVAHVFKVLCCFDGLRMLKQMEMSTTN